MDIVLTIAAVLLVAIQAHRNWLMINKPTQINIEPLDHEALAKLIEASWPAVTVSNDIQIDYDKLAEALSKQPAAVITVTTPAPLPVVIPNPQPPSGPYWQTPVVSGLENTYDDGHSNDIEINGYQARKFPAK